VALRLLCEEQTGLHRQRRREEVERIVDSAMEKKKRQQVQAASLTQIEEDAAFARRLGDEAAFEMQSFEDAQFAALLAAESEQPHHQQKGLVAPRALSSDDMTHARQIHTANCHCLVNQQIPLRHLVFSHQYYCKCRRIHVHDAKCCQINHFHDEHCRCSFFDHQGALQ